MRIPGALWITATVVVCGCSFDPVQLSALRCNEDGSCDKAGMVCVDDHCVSQTSLDTVGGDVPDAGDSADGLCGGVCTETQACCGGACIEVVADDANCGDCGVVCGSGEACVEGACRCGPTVLAGSAACPAGQVCCGDPLKENALCANTQFDLLNCGACDQPCHTGSCIAGTCTCPVGQGECPVGQKMCIDILSDDANCGGCGIQCASDIFCLSGACTCGGLACSGGFTSCCEDAAGNLFCVNEETNPNNCGGCGTVCQPGELCVDRQCDCAGTGNGCPADTLCCDDGTCVDPAVGCPCGNTGSNCTGSEACCGDAGSGQGCFNVRESIEHCGACGVACAAGQACVGGNCVCRPDARGIPTADCGGGCVPLDTPDCGGGCVPLDTPENCGKCGESCPNTSDVCCSGSCLSPADLSTGLHCGGCGLVCGTGECPNGLCDCGSGPTNLLSSSDHCGACGNACPTRPFAMQDQCINGVCVFDDSLCLPDRLNCDGPDNGCEVNAQTSEGFCGSLTCDDPKNCPQGEICTAKTCAPTPSLLDLDVGGAHACGVKRDGTIWCWGSNASSQLGDTTSTDAGEPVRAWGGAGATLDSVRAVSVGGVAPTGFSCALLADRTVTCWGFGGNGEMGDGDTNDAKDAPVVVMRQVDDRPEALSSVIQISSGVEHTCALLNDGTVWCWGAGKHGRIGNGSTANAAEASAVTGLSDAIQVGAADKHTCAVRQGGSVVCWGHNKHGQLGDGAAVDKSTPQAVQNITDAVMVAGGAEHSCALRAGGGILCWGRNDKGQLGDPSTGGPGSGTPVAVTGITPGAYIASEAKTTCAVLNSDEIQCWGENGLGQIGDNTNKDKGSPTATGLVDGLAVELGKEHVCAVRRDSVSCWGKGDGGQLGDGQMTNSLVPVLVTGLP